MKYLLFNEQINETSLDVLMNSLQSIQSPDWIFIESMGGELGYFISLVPSIKNRRINTIAGKIGSAAVLLFALGNKRYAFPDSWFGFHNVNDDLSVFSDEFIQEILSSPMSSSELGLYIQQREGILRTIQNKTLDILSERTACPRYLFEKLMRDEVILSAVEAKEIGLVHEIVQKEILF